MTGPAPKAAAESVLSAEAVTGLVNRIDWEPGSDLLRGTCHCGAQRACDDPVEMWTWLLAHPEGHRARMSRD